MDRRPPFSPTAVRHARGAEARALCDIALAHRLHSPNRVFRHLFSKMLSSYQTRKMHRWTCALAYHQERPIAVLFSTNYWVGVYVLPDYRRLGVGSYLVKKCLPMVVSPHCATDDRQALRFFASLGISSL